eukprot:c3039_g1_i1.p1 GENE.c3039_g1_i1~~c3039_g1_i1.p1  ORF type:complete len:545 (+),score=75.84 c3039_g1_i1:41-1675(+)
MDMDMDMDIDSGMDLSTFRTQEDLSEFQLSSSPPEPAASLPAPAPAPTLWSQYENCSSTWLDRSGISDITKYSQISHPRCQGSAFPRLERNSQPMNLKLPSTRTQGSECPLLYEMDQETDFGPARASKVVHILVVGETGAGKSTLINMIANYFLRGSLDDIRVAIPTAYFAANLDFESTEANIHDRKASKTDACHIYKFFHENSSTWFHFIDSPGLNDTRGTQQDEINMSRILDALGKVESISAIIWVLNGKAPRFTVNVANVLTRLGGVLPDSILDEAAILAFTNTAGDRTFSLENLPFKPCKLVEMQNSVFSMDPAKWTTKALKKYRQEWDSSMSKIEQIVNFVLQMDTQESNSFMVMKLLKQKLVQIQHELVNCFMLLETFPHDKQMTEATFLKEAEFKSVLCLRCNRICHRACSMSKESLQHCLVFREHDSLCRQCPSDPGCSVDNHYQDTVDEEVKWVTKDQLEEHVQLLQERLDECDSDIKIVCSRFDIDKELEIGLSVLQAQATAITDINLRAELEKRVNSLKKLISSRVPVTETAQ